MERRFTIRPDHFQFYLEAEDSDPDFEALWNKRTIAEALAVGYGVIAVRTARYSADTEVVLDILEQRPVDPLEEWDQVAECSIDLASGALVLSTPEGGIHEETRTAVEPGTYQALVYYGNLGLVPRNGANAEGSDYYRIALWPGQYTEPRIIKQTLFMAIGQSQET